MPKEHTAAELQEAFDQRNAVRAVVEEYDRLFRERATDGADAQDLLQAVRAAISPQHK